MIDFNISALEEKVDEIDIKLKSKQEQLHTLLNYVWSTWENGIFLQIKGRNSNTGCVLKFKMESCLAFYGPDLVFKYQMICLGETEVIEQ